ncbi:MAG: penicillin-binding transpeptidase domain-containing protein [Saprospiraceae bacterium]
MKIAGKTGTAQVEGLKQGDELVYNSTFAGFFPADNPKYSMIVVMYKNSKNLYYASQVSVPVFGEIVKKIISSQALDVALEQKDINNWNVSQLPEFAAGYSKDFKYIFDYTNLPYAKSDKKWTEIKENGNSMVMNDYKMKSKSVPDVRGMGARDAVYVLENLGMKVKMDGYGKVVKQSIEPYSKLNTQTIYLTLN